MYLEIKTSRSFKFYCISYITISIHYLLFPGKLDGWLTRRTQLHQHHPRAKPAFSKPANQHKPWQSHGENYQEVFIEVQG